MNSKKLKKFNTVRKNEYIKDNTDDDDDDFSDENRNRRRSNYIS
jgi:hypothetical protein